MTKHLQAIKICEHLVASGHIAYFAGGFVRDMLMGHDSDDIDIATSASPLEIINLFPRTLLVGLQFGIVIVLMDGEQYEVATFRKDIDYVDGRKPTKIEPASAEEDAKRRDFTINGLFFDPIEEEVHDFVGGREDIKKGIIRTIGDPYERFYEDRLRMIRAIRFMARFNFQIDPGTKEAIQQAAPLLFPSVAVERIWQEFSKMSERENFHLALTEMHRLELLGEIFQELKGVHLNAIKENVRPIEHYPKPYPPSFFLHELFKEMPLENLIEIAKRLKVSNQELNALTFYHENVPFSLHLTQATLARLYSHPLIDVALKAFAARLDLSERKLFLENHAEKRKHLSPFVERIQSKRPLLTAQDLQLEGITPGPKMGLLLKEAERLSIDEHILDLKVLLNRLKETLFWKEYHL